MAVVHWPGAAVAVGMASVVGCCHGPCFRVRSLPCLGSDAASFVLTRFGYGIHTCVSYGMRTRVSDTSVSDERHVCERHDCERHECLSHIRHSCSVSVGLVDEQGVQRVLPSHS